MRQANSGKSNYFWARVVRRAISLDADSAATIGAQSVPSVSPSPFGALSRFRGEYAVPAIEAAESKILEIGFGSGKSLCSALRETSPEGWAKNWRIAILKEGRQVSYQSPAPARARATISFTHCFLFSHCCFLVDLSRRFFVEYHSYDFR